MPAPLIWSDKMERLFRTKVISPVLDDPRSDLSQDIRLGYPFVTIRNEVLKEGLADFSVGYHDPDYGQLTASEKVLLFCFVNMKAHFFSCLAVCQEYKRNIAKLSDEPLLLVDIGCGPGTAGLAFAEAYPSKNFDYLGVDSAPSMRNKAAELWDAAQKRGAGWQAVRRFFVDNWSAIRRHPFGTKNAVLVIFSYFFASQSLKANDLKSLAEILKKMKGHRPQSPMAIIHINSPRPQANRHFQAFRKLLGFERKEAGAVCRTCEFRKKCGSVTTSIEFLHEFLWL